MKEKEKAAPDVEAIENGEGNVTSGQALSLPINQYITDTIEPQSIAKHLHRGAENTIITEKLLAIYGIKGIEEMWRSHHTARVKALELLTAVSPAN